MLEPMTVDYEETNTHFEDLYLAQSANSSSSLTESRNSDSQASELLTSQGLIPELTLVCETADGPEDEEKVEKEKPELEKDKQVEHPEEKLTAFKKLLDYQLGPLKELITSEKIAENQKEYENLKAELASISAPESASIVTDDSAKLPDYGHKYADKTVQWKDGDRVLTLSSWNRDDKRRLTVQSADGSQVTMSSVRFKTSSVREDRTLTQINQKQMTETGYLQKTWDHWQGKIMGEQQNELDSMIRIDEGDTTEGVVRIKRSAGEVEIAREFDIDRQERITHAGTNVATHFRADGTIEHTIRVGDQPRPLVIHNGRALFTSCPFTNVIEKPAGKNGERTTVIDEANGTKIVMREGASSKTITTDYPHTPDGPPEYKRSVETISATGREVVFTYADGSTRKQN